MLYRFFRNWFVGFAIITAISASLIPMIWGWSFLLFVLLILTHSIIRDLFLINAASPEHLSRLPDAVKDQLLLWRVSPSYAITYQDVLLAEYEVKRVRWVEIEKRARAGKTAPIIEAQMDALQNAARDGSHG